MTLRLAFSADSGGRGVAGADWSEEGRGYDTVQVACMYGTYGMYAGISCV